MKPSPFKGAEGLQTPQDLLRKLRHDFARVQQDERNVYAAFDFFVTAHHMLDWLHPGDDAARRAELKSSQLLMACAHLANGAKHFSLQPHHKAVADVHIAGLRSFGARHFAAATFRSVFHTPRLVVEFDGDAAIEMGSWLPLRTFAEKVLQHWEADTRLK